MSYMTVTTKHHDGFALWPTKQTRWNVRDATPFGRDLIGELAAACKAHDLEFFAYYSHLDWHHPDYWPLGRTGHQLGPRHRHPRRFEDYMEFMDAQLQELLTYRQYLTLESL